MELITINNDLSPYSENLIIKLTSNVDSTLQSNTNSKFPIKGDICILDYSCYKYNNEIKELVENNTNIKIEIGRDQVVKGMEIALSNMILSEQSEVIINSKFGYGRFGLKEKNILPNENLFFNIKLIDFYPCSSIRNVNTYKDEGVSQFKKKQYQEAYDNFIIALNIAQGISENNEKNLLLQSLYLNTANCLIKLKKFPEAEFYLNDYEKLNNTNPKIYYLRCYSFCTQPIYQKLKVLNIAEKIKSDLDKFTTLINNKNDPTLIELSNLSIVALKELENYELNKTKPKLFSGVYEDKALSEKSIDVPNRIITNCSNPIVFIDIKIDNKEEYQFEIELFNDVCPKTCENFRILCTGENQFSDGFHDFTVVGTKFHRLIKGFMIQGGDFEQNKGNGGFSIYGKTFDDENFKYNHSQAGLLSMANSGPNTNGSQFFITFNEAPWLNGKHVVFGRIIKGLEYLKILEEIQTNANDVPLKEIEVVSAGEIFKEIKNN